MIYPRIIEPFIRDASNYFPVVLLTGARQVGKSTSALNLRDNYITLDDIKVYSWLLPGKILSPSLPISIKR